MIERTDDIVPLTKAKITNMLPEKLRDLFDGSPDSLYNIVEEQLKMYLPNCDNDEEEDDEESPRKSSKEEYSGRKNLVSYEDEEEEEDEEPPKRTLSKGNKSSIKTLFKKK